MTINLRFINKIGLCIGLLLGLGSVQAQTFTQKNGADSLTTAPSSSVSSQSDSSNSHFQRYKLDGVAAVVGDYVILESDIKKLRLDIKNRLSESDKITDCQLIGRLMENKLFSHAALQDSTVFQKVTDAQIKSQVDQQVSRLVQQLHGMKNVIKFYRRKSEKDLRNMLFKIDKENSLARAMQDKITDEVEITPEEVRNYFDSIPKNKRPKFGEAVELAEIVIKPKIPQSEIDHVVDKLNHIRDQILSGKSSFATKAVLYSEGSTSVNGGKLIISPEDPLDKDFKQVAFSLRQGEISKPFKSSFGYHIIKVDKILGQKREIRHIILIPKATRATKEAAKKKLDSIRTLIVDGDISFKAAAKKYSQREETRNDGGQLINPQTNNARFELSKIDPRLYNEVNQMKEGEVSSILADQTHTGKKFYKILTVTKRIPAHTADFSKDYTRIKKIALQKKQFQAVKKWRKDEIRDTYIMVNGDYQNCDFKSNWLKK